jgi:hypothetical protein
MKLAVLFFGISYLEKYKHWYKGDNLEINYKASVDNYKKIIFEHFENKGYDIDIFLSTYKTEYSDSLLETYKPRSYRILNTFIEDRHLSRNTHFLNCLNLLRAHSIKNDIKYDHILITRFDLLFNFPFENYNFDFSKMNVFSELYNKKKIDDNFYFFPFDKLSSMIEISQNFKKGSFHLIRLDLERKFGINFLNNENKSVENLSSFDIVRKSNSKKNINNRIFNK